MKDIIVIGLSSTIIVKEIFEEAFSNEQDSQIEIIISKKVSESLSIVS